MRWERVLVLCTLLSVEVFSSRKTSSNEIVELNDLIVTEGGQSALTSDNVIVKFNYERFGRKDSGVLFRVLKRPDHGEIIANNDLPLQPQVTQFTAEDLAARRIIYVHDDSESVLDSCHLELRLETAAESAALPVNGYNFTLYVRIIPRNDAPELFLANSSIAMITNTRLKIIPTLMNASDSDDDPSKLLYYVHYQNHLDSGYFEVDDYDRVKKSKVMQFTQVDLLDGKVYFVNKGGPLQTLSLQVSDGQDVSQSKTLTVEAVELRIAASVNEPLVIPPRSSGLITSDHLRFVTNAEFQDAELRFEIADPPKRGFVQRRRYADDAWVDAATDAFDRRHLSEGRLRYVHDPGSGDNTAANDSFVFQIAGLGLQLKTAIFHVAFVEAGVALVRNAGLNVSGANEGILTADVLQAKSSIVTHKPADIVYSITASPRKGRLVYARSAGKEGWNPVRKFLDVGQNFSQGDLNDEFVRYKVTKTPLTPSVDDFEFDVVVAGFRLESNVFRFTFEPSKTDLVIVNSGLRHVAEGQSKTITYHDLFVEGGSIANVRYAIGGGPYHGTLQLADSPGTAEMNSAVAEFTQDDVAALRVHYQHDDSDTATDFFSFDVVVDDRVLHSGIFDIWVSLRNDNPPKRTANTGLDVLPNKGGAITSAQLRYVDPDVNYDDSLIQYELLNVSGGDVVLAGNHDILVRRFTQKDLDDARLYFRHRAGELCGLEFTVTDGHFYVSDVFVVKVVETFVRVRNVTRLVVRLRSRERAFVWLSDYFEIETNDDYDDDDNNMTVFSVDSNSSGVFKKLSEVVTGFTREDLKLLRISYEPSRGGIDRIEFSVDTGAGVNTKGWVIVESCSDDDCNHRFLDDFKFKKVYLDELGIVSLANFLPRTFNNFSRNTSDVHYIVTKSPAHGKLFLTDRETSGEELHEFTKDDIEEGRLYYEHQARSRLNDIFEFDVKLNTVFLVGLEIHIDVIPSKIPLNVQNLTVREGGLAYFTQNNFKIGGPFSDDTEIEFQVISGPQRGNIRNRDLLSSTPISYFSASQVLMRRIFYSNDGTESVIDSFSVMARLRSKNKLSDQKTIHVRILPINDRPPKLITNRKLKIFAGTHTAITRDYLYAEDNDTLPEEIVFEIDDQMNGQVIDLNELFIRVNNFTQADIDSHKIAFQMHKGQTTGHFTFRLTDGVNVTSPMTFHVDLMLITLTMDTLRPFGVFPGHTRPITTDYLNARTNYTNSHDNRSIIYTVRTRPSKGQLLLYDGSAGLKENVDTFSQEDLNRNSVIYRHKSQMTDWTQNDSFAFEVHSTFAQSIPVQTFAILVSYGNVDFNDSFWSFACQGVEVGEGGRVEVMPSALNVGRVEAQLTASGLDQVLVTMVIQQPPRHGSVTRRGQTLTKGGKIVQQDIDKGYVVYSHDDSETLSDAFSFHIEIQAKIKGQSDSGSLRTHSIASAHKVFPIVVIPKDDQRFVLKTPSPSLELVQGASVLITKEVLHTWDPDTAPDHIRYFVESPPTNGRLERLDGADHDHLPTFTQKQINDRKIRFVQDGSPDSGAFYFRVSDGQHKPLYKVFNIIVHQLVLNVSFHQIEVMQGQNEAAISTSNFRVDTNGNRTHLWYNITMPPRCGNLVNKGAIKVDRFSQEDVDSGRIAYVQKDLSGYEDDFEFFLYDGQNLIHGKMEIVVRPKLKQRSGDRPFYAAAGNASKITTLHLDATELAELSRSDPVYHVIQVPAHGVLVRNASSPPPPIRVRRDDPQRGKKNDEQEPLHNYHHYPNALFRFTHNDIVKERLAYQPRRNVSPTAFNDVFVYILKANGVQPAKGAFEIVLYPPDVVVKDSPSHHHQVKDGISARNSTGKDTGVVYTRDERSLQALDRNYIIAIVVLVVLISAIAIVTVLACLRRRRREAMMKEASVVSLDPPPPTTAATTPPPSNGEIAPLGELDPDTLHSLQRPGSRAPVYISDDSESPGTTSRKLATIPEQPDLEEPAAVVVVEPVLRPHRSEGPSRRSSRPPSLTGAGSDAAQREFDEKLLLYFEKLTAV